MLKRPRNFNFAFRFTLTALALVSISSLANAGETNEAAPKDADVAEIAETADRPEPIAALSQQLQNLVFFSHEGRWVSAPTLTFTTSDHASISSASSGALQSSLERRRAKLEDQLSYGFSQHLRIAITIGDYFGSRAETTSDPSAPTTTGADGFSNPEFAVSYRWVDNQLAGIYADLSLSATPNLFSHDILPDGKDSNGQIRGGTAALSLPAYWFWKSNELSLRGDLQRRFEATASGANFEGATTTASYWSKSITVQDRYHFLLNRLYVQLGFTFYLPFSFDTSTDISSGTTDVQLSVKRSMTLGCLLNDRIAVAVSTSSTTSDATRRPGAGTGNQIGRVESDIAFSASFLL